MPTIESAEGSVCLAFPWLLCGQPLLTPSPGGHPEVPRPEADPQMGPAGGDAGAALRAGRRTEVLGAKSAFSSAKPPFTLVGGV